MTDIKTPETHPDHHTVGKRFLAWDGATYYCDSYDPRIGYWMTLIDPATNEIVPLPEHLRDRSPYDLSDIENREYSRVRRNVSERAIGINYREIYAMDGRLFTSWGIYDGPKASRF